MKESLERIIDKQRQWNYHMINILRRPATDDEISNAENELGFSLNDELIELYKFADGVDIDEQTPSGKTGLIPIHNFLSLDNAIRYYQEGINIEVSFQNQEQDYKPGKQLFPFLEDGAGNCYWVDLNKNSRFYGFLYWTNTFGSEPDYEFSSLRQFIQIIEKAYLDDMFFVDADGYLDSDWDKWNALMESGKPKKINYS